MPRTPANSVTTPAGQTPARQLATYKAAAAAGNTAAAMLPPQSSSPVLGLHTRGSQAEGVSPVACAALFPEQLTPLVACRSAAPHILPLAAAPRNAPRSTTDTAGNATHVGAALGVVAGAPDGEMVRSRESQNEEVASQRRSFWAQFAASASGAAPPAPAAGEQMSAGRHACVSAMQRAVPAANAHPQHTGCVTCALDTWFCAGASSHQLAGSNDGSVATTSWSSQPAGG